MNAIKILFLKNRPGEAAMIDQARKLIEADQLLWENDYFQILVALDLDKRVIGTAQIKNNLIKEVCIDRALRGMGISERLVTEAVGYFRTQSIYSYFVFTKPDTADIFKSLGLRELSRVGDRAVFLEGGSGITDYLNSLKYPAIKAVISKTGISNARLSDLAEKKKYSCGSIVLNCNPMTKGHMWLINRAFAECDRLYIFIVSTDKSAFSTDQRMSIVRKQINNDPEIAVNPTGPYMVSDYLFPAYFTGKSNKSSIQAELDARLFAGLIAPALGIKARFVGTEPFCAITREYNLAMNRVFPEYAIDFIEFQRVGINENMDNQIISASLVRKELGKNIHPDDLADFLAPESLCFLKTEQGRVVIKKIITNHENAKSGQYIKELME